MLGVPSVLAVVLVPMVAGACGGVRAAPAGMVARSATVRSVTATQTTRLAVLGGLPTLFYAEFR